MRRTGNEMALLYLLHLCILHIFLIEPGLGVQIQLDPNRFILGRPAATNQKVICRASGTTDIDAIFDMSLYRNRTGRDPEIIARADITTPGVTTAVIVTDLPADIQALEPSASGGLDLNILENSEFTVSFKPEMLSCLDATTFECRLNYRTTSGESAIVKQKGDLEVLALPSDVSMKLRINNSRDDEPYSEENPKVVNTGDVITLSCNGVIGSDNQTKIYWNETSVLQSDLSFIRFSGDSSQIDQVPTGPVDCHYSRSSSISYQVQLTDSNRLSHKFAFSCYILTPYINEIGGEYLLETTQTCYFVPAVTGNGKQAEVASAGSSNIGAIIGGVVGGLVAVTLIVVLVCFLWYRRAGGESYRTKEERGAENPNMAPESYPSRIEDEYSKPAKKRGHETPTRGHENPTLDEPHETNPDKYYENFDERSRGRANYAMDDDDDDYHSRDGSPRPSRNHNHVGDDNASFGTGV